MFSHFFIAGVIFFTVAFLCWITRLVAQLHWRPMVRRISLLAIIGAGALFTAHCQAGSPTPIPVTSSFTDIVQGEQVLQVLSWGDWKQERLVAANTAFANTGRRLYVVGDIDGGFRSRSNVYDLYTFGEPQPGDPLANELQGVWAQPVKALDGYEFVVEANGERWPLTHATNFTQTFAAAQFEFEHPQAGLRAERTDFVAQDLPILFTTLDLHNEGREKLDIELEFRAYFDLEDAWFTSLASSRNVGEAVSIIEDHLVARANGAPQEWAVVVGGEPSPRQVQVIKKQETQQVGQLSFSTGLAPGESQAWTIAIAVESESGEDGARRLLETWLPQQDALLAVKQALYDGLLTDGPHLITPDAKFNMAFDVARANMQMLEAETPALGPHFYAGLEMFPFWFSNDGAYSMPGLLINNMVEAARNHLLIGARYQENGQVPHQISPAGNLVGAGNAQETPQWVSAVWDFYRWTGDREFLATAYPIAVSGLFDYTLDTIDRDDDGYPEGPAMVERQGMGPEKVDATSYLWLALGDLAQMAEELNDTGTSERARRLAADLQVNFDADWWLAEEQVYADSLLKFRNTPRFDGQWTVAVPLEAGIAPPERASLILERIKRDYLNQWGLVHTLGEDERVWTLPTATLSRGAYNYGDSELGFTLLQDLAQALDHGSIGMFHELLPEGLSFLQLWSGATFVRGVVEDLLGITVRADLHQIRIMPQLPEMWDSIRLDNLRFGKHTINIHISPESVGLEHVEGSVPLKLVYHPTRDEGYEFTLQPGDSINIGNNGERRD
ncbi:MAG: amylo-alpha-1,6-glucosidase [Candidatus Promineifilaceae bacterium]